MDNSSSFYGDLQQIARTIISQRLSRDARRRALLALLRECPAEVLVAELSTMVMEWQEQIDLRFGPPQDSTIPATPPDGGWRP